MKFNAIVAAIFGLLVSVTMAIPAADNGLVAHSNGLKGRSNKLVPIDNNDVAVTDALTNNRVVTNHIFTRSNNTASEVATIAATNKNLFTITLCDGANRSGQCTDVQMQNNYCMALPILINTISVYIPPQTWCWILNNEECHFSGDINDLYVTIFHNYDDLYAAGLTFRPRGWMCVDNEP